MKCVSKDMYDFKKCLKKCRNLWGKLNVSHIIRNMAFNPESSGSKIKNLHLFTIPLWTKWHHWLQTFSVVGNDRFFSPGAGMIQLNFASYVYLNKLLCSAALQSVLIIAIIIWGKIKLKLALTFSLSIMYLLLFIKADRHMAVMCRISILT